MLQGRQTQKKMQKMRNVHVFEAGIIVSFELHKKPNSSK
jgi:hypothetical protein